MPKFYGDRVRLMSNGVTFFIALGLQGNAEGIWEAEFMLPAASAKHLAMMLRAQVKLLEEKAGSVIEVPMEVHQRMHTAPEDW